MQRGIYSVTSTDYQMWKSTINSYIIITGLVGMGEYETGWNL